MNAFYHGDCLFVMKHDIAPESVDLIYLDPPFFTGKIQKGTAKWQPGAMEVSYEDSKQFWKEKGLASYAPEWLKHIALTRPDFAAYLFYMMERLEACHRVLKKTGSIYLHCDQRASHYLKMVMDEVFSHNNFRNEVVWCYTGASEAKDSFPAKHDIILFYAKSSEVRFNYDSIRLPYKDNNKTPAKWTDGIHQKHPLGTKCLDWFADIPSFMTASQSKERTGYPTQKPIALLERIIKVSSNKGDIILDPFCGCGTAIIAAQKLNRQWIGIDINRAAYEVSTNRLGELPLSFSHVTYISRDLDEVKAIDKPAEFEKWVNEYYKATKPYPDRGVDGITPEGTPIQVKTFQIKYDTIDKLLSSSKFHPLVPKPIKKLILVSQIGFDDSARKREFEIKATEDIEVILATPEQMLKQEEN